MTFEQLEYYIAAAEHQTFLSAAESLHTTQSSLSKQIIKLEKELDVLLFDRSRRSAILTEAGLILYQEALLLIKQYQQMQGSIQTYKNNIQNKLRIGTLPLLTQYHLTQIFKEFTKRYPDITYSLEEVEEKELMEGFIQDKYDLIIARQTMIDNRKYKCYPVAEDELAAVLPAAHPLAKRQGDLSAITLEEISKESFILMNPYTSIYEICMEQFKRREISANIIRTARVESIISAVAVQEGISLLPKSNFEVFHHNHVKIIPLYPKICLPVILVEKKRYTSPANGASASRKRLIQFIAEVICKNDG